MISIIMPSYNQGKFVEAALNSVLNQDYEDKEIIFIDGGSSDNTMEIVGRYASRIAYYVSEPDEGQSDALRKGFEKAKGDVFTWLNTDDLLLPGALREVAQHLADFPDLGWIGGNVVWIDVADRILNCRKAEVDWVVSRRMGIFSACGPSAFFRRDLYYQVGGINLDLNYMMDTDLWWRFIISGARFDRLKRYTWALRLHQDAKMSGHLFLDPQCSKQQQAAVVKALEHKHIISLRSAYCLSSSLFVSSVVKLMNRLISLRYLCSLYDSVKFKGESITELCKIQ